MTPRSLAILSRDHGKERACRFTKRVHACKSVSKKVLFMKIKVPWLIILVALQTKNHVRSSFSKYSR